MTAIIDTYNAYAFVGGTRAVDSFPVTELKDHDRCFCAVSNVIYYYEFNATATDVGDGLLRIRPVDFSTQGVWYLQSFGGPTIPVGSYLDFAGDSPPDGFLVCDGTILSRATYASLFAVIGTRYGVGDGTTTFSIPDWSGLFPRCSDNGKGVDPDAGSRTDAGGGTAADEGDVVGSLQSDEIKAHDHEILGVNPGRVSDHGTDYDVNSTESLGKTTEETGGAETRPVNMYQLRCIKY